MKSIICSVVLVTLVSPSLADEYWVEYNYSTHKCSMVETKSQHPAEGTAQGIAAATTEGIVSDPATVATSSAAPTNNNNLDPTAAVVAWAGKKDVAAAAWYDARRTSLETAVRTPEQVLTEFKLIGVMYAIWARERATSEAARSYAANALIGTVSESREIAEIKMGIMRKCVLAH